MPAFNNNFTDELRARLSIVDIVGRRVPLKKKGQNYWGCCPFHNEKTPSFSVNEEKGFYHCFGCGEHGDIISFTMKTNNIDFKSAIEDLAQQAGLKLPDYKPKTKEQIEREQGYFDIYESVCKIYQDNLFDAAGAHALDYLRKRGFDDAKIKKYRIGYAPKTNLVSQKFGGNKNTPMTGLVRVGDYGPYDFFRDRLMFPIFNAYGQVIAFSGRSLDGSEPKYINTSDTDFFHKRQTLFGFNFAREAIHLANRSIVVEGQIDAIQMQTNGFGETVAPLGTALTEDHLQILAKSNRNIVFCFDGDAAGQKAAARAVGLILPLIRDNSDVRFAFVTGGKDPDDILKSPGGQSKMKQIIDSAIPLVDFLWQTANNSFIIATPNGRTQAEKFLKTETAKITDPSLRREFEQEYDQRKFQQWHQWKKMSEKGNNIPIPKISAITQKTLSVIADSYPDLIEKHSDFLHRLNIDLGAKIEKNVNPISKTDAEKFIIALKLNFYLDELKTKLKTANNSEDIKKLNLEIIKTQENINKLSEL